jgi:transcriptional regulator with XRE-family HTH domain
MYKGRISNVAERLSEALRIKGVKQVELCKQLDIPKGPMSHYLSGKYEPRQSRLNEIAIALNVSEAWLMGYDVPMERPVMTNNSIESSSLTDAEKELLDLFRRVPQEQQTLVLSLIQAALKNRK